MGTMGRTLIAFSLICFVSIGIMAQELGVFSDHADIGDVNLSGDVEYNSTDQQYVVSGAGDGIGETEDSFHFLYTEVTSNFVLKAKVLGDLFDSPEPNAKAGIMVRSSLDANAMFYSTLLTWIDFAITDYWRANTGESVNSESNGVLTLEDHDGDIEIVRLGDEIQFYYIDFFTGERLLHSTMNLGLEDPVYIGLVVSSYFHDDIATAYFESVEVTLFPFEAFREIPTGSFLPGETLEDVKLHVNVREGETVDSVITETLPNGWIPTNIEANEGETSIEDGTIIWNLAVGEGEYTLTYDVSIPEDDSTLDAIFRGEITQEDAPLPIFGDQNVQVNQPQLRSEWTSEGRGLWLLRNGILKSFPEDTTTTSSTDTHDPKHIWVDIDIGPDYTVKADVRMDTWEPSNADNDNHKKGGIAARINPDDDQRAINLVFQNNTNRVNFLNDWVAFGPNEEYPWEVGVWYEFTLTVEGQIAKGRIQRKNDPSDFLELQDWEFNINNREEGFPGLACSRANLITSYDNFQVLVDDEIVFEDDFNYQGFISERSIHDETFLPGTKLENVQITVRAFESDEEEVFLTEILPEGWTAEKIQTSAGEAIFANGQITWDLTGLSDEISLTYDAVIPTEEERMTIEFDGMITKSDMSFNIGGDFELTGDSGLGSDWVNGGRGLWFVRNGILTCDPNGDLSDPKHIWVGIDFGPDYTVQADVRMDEWEEVSNLNHRKAGISARINPEDDQRGINLLFHNNTGQVNFLNDWVAGGPQTDYTWEVGEWYTFTLTVDEQVATGRIEKQDDPNDFVELEPWEFSGGVNDRATGYAGLNGCRADLVSSYDNFSITVDGEEVFSDTFEMDVGVMDWAIY